MKQNKEIKIPDPNDPATYTKSMIIGGIMALLGPIMLVITYLYILGNWRFPMLVFSGMAGFSGISAFTRNLTMYIITKKRREDDNKA
ncbi:MAG: hypothetical protein GX061_02370 [Eubacteriaceae bacterium]|nr:hypothetical protein [Eubacteriaceae bacterium]